MVLIFWQGIISIHQTAFLEALAKRPMVSKVFMMVEQDITPYRKNMGWEVPELENVTVIVAPTKEEIAQTFRDYDDAVHILGGIRSGAMMSVALDAGMKQKAKMGVLTEPYERKGIKGKLRDLKYFYYKLRYFKHIDFVLAVGRAGVNTFKRLGFKTHRIFPWAYFVSAPVKELNAHRATDGPVKIIYAGRIEAGKGISRFVAELGAVKDALYTLDIYGQGPEEAALKKFVADSGLSERIYFHPFLKYNELVKEYGKYDWVVLPSVAKDGWGVIVSEGLLSGLKAICSNICGASWAVKDNFNGVVFDWGEAGSCKAAIDAMLHMRFADSVAIKNRAEGALSAEAGAKYFLSILGSVYDNKPMPAVPWEA